MIVITFSSQCSQLLEGTSSFSRTLRFDRRSTYEVYKLFVFVFDLANLRALRLF